MIIDKERAYTPFRAVDKSKINFSDHFTLILSFSNLPLRNTRPARTHRKCVRWNTNKEGGWSAYKELTEDNDALTMIAQEGSDI